MHTHTSSFPDVWFSLTNTTYQNNSLVNLESIGKDDNDALLCITACCQPPHAAGSDGSIIGNWFFPNGTRVPSEGSQWDLYRMRDRMVVQLYRKKGGVDGIYCCEIHDAMNVLQTIYIGVYNASSGTGE